MYSCELIDLPLLSLESRLNIMREFATSYNVSDNVWVPQIWIHQLLLDTGGLPRALEFLFTELFGQNFINIKEFFENLEKRILIPLTIYANVANDINRAYKIKTYAKDHKMLVYELIYRNIMVIKSDISDELQDGDSTENLEHLEHDRHLILRKLEGKDKVLIDIPYFFMYIFMLISLEFSQKYKHSIFTYSDWSWENWKIFIADFISSHITMIDVLNKNKLLKLKNFFRGAQGNDITLNLLINFEPVKIYKSKHQFPCLDLSAKGGKAAKDSNPNLSAASELTSRFKAIKEDIGEKIEKTRKRKTFRSHEEFCEEFPELANDEIRNNFVYYPYPPHIEPFEYSNKRARAQTLAPLTPPKRQNL
ncbi:207_t:CDS:2 [Funneliformis caledonium]|uniref:207_t:CDS:1 n=1 Tax=Funneliformis caledonium TaxID=1117310 RepID=A0A9N9AZU7_9GLOM|nr:207_t:CDS:2 [Funneliformis caledonium]